MRQYHISVRFLKKDSTEASFVYVVNANTYTEGVEIIRNLFLERIAKTGESIISIV